MSSVMGLMRASLLKSIVLWFTRVLMSHAHRFSTSFRNGFNEMYRGPGLLYFSLHYSDMRETAFLFQRLSLTVRRYNAGCFNGPYHS